MQHTTHKLKVLQADIYPTEVYCHLDDETGIWIPRTNHMALSNVICDPKKVVIKY